MASHDQFVEVDGLTTRYLEEGKGPAVILLHGASLGSSADVWERNLALEVKVRFSSHNIEGGKF